jgi:hypothetical protein
LSEGFAALREALIRRLVERVSRGELTVRAAARAAHLSQPQLANALAGRRRLSIESCDALMISLAIEPRDLL